MDEGEEAVRRDKDAGIVTVYPPEHTALPMIVMQDPEKVSRSLTEHVPSFERFLDLALIPRPDNAYDLNAVSIALPKRYGGTVEDRRIGYLAKSYKDPNLGVLFSKLARYSGGEVRCFGEVVHDVNGVGIVPLLPRSLELEEDLNDFLLDSVLPALDTMPSLRSLLEL